MSESQKLRRSLMIAALALLVALLSVTAATFAWYIYHTNVRTTEVKMSAGSSISLQISNALDGPYSSATQMEEFKETLVPVSTDSILGGFQRVNTFETIQENDRYRLIVKSFRPSDEVEYYKTSLYLRTSAMDLDIYLSRVGVEDGSEENPVSTAARLGLVIEGEDGKTQEFIYELNPEINPAVDPNQTEYPIDNGMKDPRDGIVLKHDKTDGTTVDFTPLTKENMCEYHDDSDTFELKETSTRICTISGDGKGDYGTPQKVDVYLWLEGCDRDCALNLAGETMKVVALNFAGFPGNGG